MKRDYFIKPAKSTEDIQSVRQLFKQYAASLTIDLGYQGFEEEASGLPGKYAAPLGCLLLALTSDGVPVACAGLRPLEEPGICEMKRLFVLPPARGMKLGQALVIELVRVARQLGYHKMRLDTLDTMKKAINLYEQFGFDLIEAYYAPVPAGTVFMELDLLDAKRLGISFSGPGDQDVETG